jgi:histone acetyltransferase (RNA polymerase elongator complex component)
MSKRYIIPIFVPHYGCTHNCIFCNQTKITNVTTTITCEDVENIIEKYLSYFWRDIKIEVAFYGGSFTAIGKDIQSQLLEIPYRYKEKGIIHEIRLSTRPDAIDTEILDNLKKYQVDTIELGVQSLDKDVLIASERDHSVSDVYKAVELIKSYGFNLGLQMMVGLPNDSIKKSVFTAKEFIKMSPDIVRIYPTLVIKDTNLSKLYKNDEYKALSLEEAVDICTILLILFYLDDINVIRVGLQPTDSIQLGMDVIAGPFHPAFRQLVESNIYKLAVEDYLNNIGFNIKGKEIFIKANSSKISSISGHKSSNIKYFIEKYEFSRVRIYSDDILNNEIIIYIDNKIGKLELETWMKNFIANFNY